MTNMHTTAAMFRSGNLKLETLKRQEQIDLFIYLMDETAENFRLMAQIWAYWSKDGSIPERLQNLPIASELLRISDGRLAPEVSIKYKSNPVLFEKLSKLPLADQERLAEQGKVQVRRDNTGKVEDVSLSSLSIPEIDRVFKNERVIPAEKQEAPIKKYTAVKARRQLILHLSEDDYDAFIADAKHEGLTVNAFAVNLRKEVAFLRSEVAKLRKALAEHTRSQKRKPVEHRVS